MNRTCHTARRGPAMRLPRVRLTMRGMMIAVAVVALGVGIETMRRRRSTFRERAALWAQLESIEQRLARHDESAALRRDESARAWDVLATDRARLDKEFSEVKL